MAGKWAGHIKVRMYAYVDAIDVEHHGFTEQQLLERIEAAVPLLEQTYVVFEPKTKEQFEKGVGRGAGGSGKTRRGANK